MRTASLVGALACVMLATPATYAEKSAGAAASLGGIIGFGTGYYYLGNNQKGPLFTAIDGGLVVGIIVADDDPRLWLGLGLLGSHVYQAVDGLNEGHRHGLSMVSRRQPIGLQLGFGDFGFYDSTRVGAWRSRGGEWADLASWASKRNELMPTWRVHCDAVSRGVGLSYNSRF
ncbi:MAG: hypothetical protein HYU66_11700 [Armatimonadetes bacterium]|nr:hypothetical protein [Armatimonadota bacterium]